METVNTFFWQYGHLLSVKMFVGVYIPATVAIGFISTL